MFSLKNIHWHIGCSGFYYKDWKEIFYPKGLAQTKWFAYYCENFNTLELNASFYRFPRVADLKNWYQKSPSGFSFSVKAPRSITHYRRFIGTESMLSDFYKSIREGLQDKLGPVLFQFYRNVEYSPEFLSRLIDQVDPSFTNVLEFRHASWWQPEVYNILAKHRIIFSGISHPQLPDQVIINNKTVYYRFHGVPRLYYSQYSPEFLSEVITAIVADPLVKEAFLYFNNTAEASAIRNAQFVQQQLAIKQKMD